MDRAFSDQENDGPENCKAFSSSDNSQQHWKRVVEADENVIIPANEVVHSSLDTWLQLFHSVQFPEDNATPPGHSSALL